MGWWIKSHELDSREVEGLYSCSHEIQSVFLLQFFKSLSMFLLSLNKQGNGQRDEQMRRKICKQYHLNTKRIVFWNHENACWHLTTEIKSSFNVLNGACCNVKNKVCEEKDSRQSCKDDTCKHKKINTFKINRDIKHKVCCIAPARPIGTLNVEIWK